eukprot:m.73199 g.73199  ORF g.73199 m.73199 type:complete len:56 (+) comp11767_c0_seq17:1976-2143(+)
MKTQTHSNDVVGDVIVRLLVSNCVLKSSLSSVEEECDATESKNGTNNNDNTRVIV